MENHNEKERDYLAAKNLVKNNYKEFWRRESSRLLWQKPFSEVHDGKFATGKWFVDGQINASVNCLDRHIDSGLGEKIAITFANETGEVKTYSFSQLHKLTCDIATILHDRGIKAGDRVSIYMPMGAEAIAAMLACARIGATHTVIFAGFSKDALCERILDSQSLAIITAEQTIRKGQDIALKNIVEEALLDPRTCCVSTVLCFNIKSPNHDPRIIEFSAQSAWPECVSKPKGFDSNHPLFILYTSGTTGKPKGIIHGTGGYLTQTISTTKWFFDLNDHDLFWCTADVGWITGHTYVTYGPLMLGAGIFIYEGALNYPTPASIYQLIDSHGITILYTAPTAIRMFMGLGEEFKGTAHLSTLRLLGSVGEPINPEAWLWYSRVFGNNICPIIDTWWQTETGAIMIAPLPMISPQIPGSACTPFLGIDAAVVDDNGHDVADNTSGFLVIKQPWPSLALGIWGDQERFRQTYFSVIPHVFFTGDGAKKDSMGNFTLGGRIDDVVNISGHRLGTAEIESALVLHESVSEAAVVGVEDEICGQRLVAFVTLMKTYAPSKKLENELKAQVKSIIGSFAKPSQVLFKIALPKTRSGKIMRRLLRSMANGQEISSDISTLEDPNTVV